LGSFPVGRLDRFPLEIDPFHEDFCDEDETDGVMPVSLLFMVVKSLIWPVGHRSVSRTFACSPSDQGEQGKCQHRICAVYDSLMTVS